jgi:hypothetical protein
MPRCSSTTSAKGCSVSWRLSVLALLPGRTPAGIHSKAVAVREALAVAARRASCVTIHWCVQLTSWGQFGLLLCRCAVQCPLEAQVRDPAQVTHQHR